jgi:putative inorganic carbon (HCO3(-)) transporter
MSRQSIGTLKDKLNKKVSDLSVKTFIRYKLHNWLGVLILCGVGCLFGVLLAKDMMIGLGLFAVVAGIFIVFLCFTNVVFGFYLLLFIGFFGYFFSNALTKGNLPIGALYDCLVLINFLGMLMSGKDFKASWKQFTKTPLVIFMFVPLMFSLVEMFNPYTMGATATNFLAIRKFVECILLLFMAYTLFNTYEMVKKYVLALLAMCAICALYGCIQEWHGLFPWELESIMADPHAYALLFVGGTFRKFSTMADPAAFGIMMAVCTVFFVVLSVYEKDSRLKLAFIIVSVLMTLGMSYSGTRTAYATALAGIIFFILFNIDKSAIRKFGGFMLIVFLILEFGPFSSIAAIRRFRTTFEGSKDESMKVRLLARKWVKPYIQSHPIGGGLGTTGFAGQAAFPGHPLAGFMPDGAYVTRATETGWIGLLIVCSMYFYTLVVGIQGFFRSKDPTMKIYYSAAVSCLFAFYTAEYTQSAVGGVSDSAFYYALIAIILNLNKLHDNPQAWYTA